MVREGHTFLDCSLSYRVFKETQEYDFIIILWITQDLNITKSCNINGGRAIKLLCLGSFTVNYKNLTYFYSQRNVIFTRLLKVLGPNFYLNYVSWTLKLLEYFSLSIRANKNKNKTFDFMYFLRIVIIMIGNQISNTYILASINSTEMVQC